MRVRYVPALRYEPTAHTSVGESAVTPDNLRCVEEVFGVGTTCHPLLAPAGEEAATTATMATSPTLQRSVLCLIRRASVAPKRNRGKARGRAITCATAGRQGRKQDPRRGTACLGEI